MTRFTLLVAVSVACYTLAGCGSKPQQAAPQAPAEAHAEDEHADEHPTAGPHGGHLIELGEEQYHAELLHDDATETVTVYLLDAAGKEPVKADGPTIVLQVFREGKFVDYTLQAGDAPSVFTLTDAALCDALGHDASVRARLRVTIAGAEFTGALEHDAHAHE